MSKSYKLNLNLKNLLTLKIIKDLNNKKSNLVLDIDILSILDTDSMNELLSDAIKEDAKENDNISLLMGAKNNSKSLITLKKKNGTIYRIDLDSKKLTISLADIVVPDISISVYEDQLNRKVIKNISGNIDLSESDKKQLKNSLINTIDGTIDERIKGLTKEQDKKILAELISAKKYLNKIMKETYKKAIKEKAETLGNIETKSESNENGIYRLRLEVSE